MILLYSLIASVAILAIVFTVLTIWIDDHSCHHERGAELLAQYRRYESRDTWTNNVLHICWNGTFRCAACGQTFDRDIGHARSVNDPDHGWIVVEDERPGNIARICAGISDAVTGETRRVE